MQKKHKNILLILFALIATVALYFLSRSNYLFFHGIVEYYSIIVAAGIFIVTWNSRKYNENRGLVFLGIAYLFVAGLDFLHTIAYQGTGIFASDTFYANQLWVIARFIESVSILLFIFIPWQRDRYITAGYFWYTAGYQSLASCPFLSGRFFRSVLSREWGKHRSRS